MADVMALHPTPPPFQPNAKYANGNENTLRTEKAMKTVEQAQLER